MVNNGAAALALVTSPWPRGREVVVAAARWSRSATASGFPICWSPSARDCARWARRTGCASRTTGGDRRADTRSSSRCTRRTSGRGVHVVGGVAGLATLACRWSCGHRLRPAAPHPRLPDEPDARVPRAGRHTRHRLRRQAARRSAVRAAARRRRPGAAAAAATRSRGRCGSTSSPWRRSRRRCAGHRRRSPQALAARPTTCWHAPAGSPARSASTLAEAVEVRAAVGGGGAPGVVLPSAAVAVPARSLRHCGSAGCRWSGGSRGRLLLDLIAVARRATTTT